MNNLITDYNDEIIKHNKHKINSFDEFCNNIYQIRPIRNEQLWKLYKQALSTFWTLEELDFSRDKNDWDNKLNDDEKYFLSHILAFFSQSDFIVNINLEERFLHDIKQLPSYFHPYTQMFYDCQKLIENIHSETYGYMLNIYITDSKQLKYLTEGITTIPTIEKKALWAHKWINDINTDFIYRLVAFASLEGIFFSGSFCAIFWLRDRNILQGLIQSNRFISRDEGLHCLFACELFEQVKHYYEESNIDINYNFILDIIKEAVTLEKEFITNAFNCRLLGINADLMKEYIEFVADILLVNLNMSKHYNTSNPFSFMESISLENKTNFFEKRPTEYAKAGSKTINDNDTRIKLLDEFFKKNN
jgi:ribonucleotide reductase beta subunit family protein with ferritin-like domain